MQLALLPGTILQNRYCLLQVLGHGGFGRTYLVEDQARFNELCVLKEYTPKHTGIYVLDKSQELFNREAKTLYQIQHPQIPQFRAFFKENERLFLMQDYIAGKTYRTLLNERQKAGQTFSEKEMVQFLFQILPVLNYIHNIELPDNKKGIIHRDISPENLICRQSDQMPVLIDFGTVKHMVFSSKSTEDIPPETIVGKMGYAPEEQILTGVVFPNSDLYALGITVIVLMSGRKPQDFSEEFLKSGYWRKDVPSISCLFASVLDRMIHPIPSRRYQSATELLLSLRSLQGLIDSLPPPIPPNLPKVSETCGISQTQSSELPNPLIKLILSLGEQIVSASPLEKSIVAISAGLILLFTIVLREAAVLLESTPLSILGDRAEKLIETLPSPPTATNPTIVTPRIVTLKGKVAAAKQPVRYYMDVQSRQQMNALVKEGNVLMTLYQPNQKPLIERITRLDNVSLEPGDYTFEVYVDENGGITESDYTIEVKLDESN